MCKITKNIFGLLGQVSRTVRVPVFVTCFAVGFVVNVNSAQAQMAPSSNPTYNGTVDWPSETVDPAERAFPQPDSNSATPVTKPPSSNPGPLPPWAKSAEDYVPVLPPDQWDNEASLAPQEFTDAPEFASAPERMLPPVSVPWHAIPSEIGFVAPTAQAIRKLVKESKKPATSPELVVEAEIVPEKIDLTPKLESVLETAPVVIRQAETPVQLPGKAIRMARPSTQHALTQPPQRMPQAMRGFDQVVTPTHGYPLHGRAVPLAQPRRQIAPVIQPRMPQGPISAGQRMVPAHQAPRVGARYPLGTQFR